MMKYLYIFIILLLTVDCSSQTNDTLIEMKLSPKNGWVLEYVDGPAFRYCNGEKCNGTIIDTFENGAIKHKALYIEGNEHGIVIDYYQNNQIKSIGECDNGVRIGEWVFYYESGKIESLGNFNKGFQYAKKWTDFYENGNIKSKYEFSEEEFPLYDYDFSLTGDTIYADFPIDWQTKTYSFYERYDNGQLKETGQKKYVPEEGWVLIGVRRWFNESGIIIKEVNY